MVGFVGVGLMGWGMAKNAVEKGYPLRVIAHRKREAVDDLVGRGARRGARASRRWRRSATRSSSASPARREVEAVVAEIRAGGAAGAHHHRLLDLGARRHRAAGGGARRRAASRSSTRRCRARRSTPGTARRRPTSAGRRSWSRTWRPLLATWANVVIPVGGPVGSAHALKLINNLVALGYAAIWSECYAMVRKIGVEPGGVPRDRVELGDELRQLPDLLEVRGRGRRRTRTTSRSRTAARISPTTTGSRTGTARRR